MNSGLIRCVFNMDCNLFPRDEEGDFPALFVLRDVVLVVGIVVDIVVGIVVVVVVDVVVSTIVVVMLRSKVSVELSVFTSERRSLSC